MIKEDNVMFDNNNRENIPDTDNSNINNVDCFIFEKEYCTLYDELIDKCYPYNFFTPIFDKEKFNTANEIYEILSNNKDFRQDELIQIRNKAIEKFDSENKAKAKLASYLLSINIPQEEINAAKAALKDPAQKSSLINAFKMSSGLSAIKIDGRYYLNIR